MAKIGRTSVSVLVDHPLKFGGVRVSGADVLWLQMLQLWVNVVTVGHDDCDSAVKKNTMIQEQIQWVPKANLTNNSSRQQKTNELMPTAFGRVQSLKKITQYKILYVSLYRFYFNVWWAAPRVKCFDGITVQTRFDFLFISNCPLIPVQLSTHFEHWSIAYRGALGSRLPRIVSVWVRDCHLRATIISNPRPIVVTRLLSRLCRICI